MLQSIFIKNNEFKVAVADKADMHYKGLSGMERLGNKKGMLFIFPEMKLVRMVMRDMNFPLDFIFIKGNKITQLGSLDNKNENNHIDSKEKIDLILEVNKGIIESLNLKVNDEVKFSDDLKTHYEGVQKFKEGGKFQMVGDVVYKVKLDDVPIEKGKMQILDTNGVVTANVDTGARVFSRQHTKEIIDSVKSKDKKKIAETIIKIYDIQDNQKQDYVTKEC